MSLVVTLACGGESATAPRGTSGTPAPTLLALAITSAPNQWFYAPQLRVRASPGRTVSVLLLRFTIPAIGGFNDWGCAATLTSAARELNGEVYGDWAFEIGPADQASGADATAIVTYVDDARTMATRTVRGPVVRGSLPTTYGGDPGACFHGYGSTASRVNAGRRWPHAGVVASARRGILTTS